ncbi:NAD(P)-binding protein [Thelephora ganbajun]|uniref:NAD(P)-binding protein n=1 Tax=Thelephora ganbajun TaxID=370292 RepID=A0ACB6Z763_THEGA|nr:NAD(P)-binding protein [Thelephora ganbajun]
MTTIPDVQLYAHSERLKGKVVLITGAAAGIGREAALQYARSKAKLVLGDLNEPGLEKVVSEIRRAGGEAIGLRCDVTTWDDQLKLFEAAIEAYHSVDVVVANAGVNEIGSFWKPKLENGKPTKPSLSTVNINLVGTIYTAHLALHYLDVNRTHESTLKSIVLLGSMASWQASAQGVVYSASKHAVLGLARAMHGPLSAKGIRVAVVHPFFTDTGLMTTMNRIAVAGIPLLPIERVAGTIIFSSTDPDIASTGAVWLLPDDGLLLRLEKEIVKGGVYDVIAERNKRFIG